jgi:hypothetical protein
VSGSTCDVCGAPSVGVACSALGPVSFAYCGECAACGAEPYGATVGMVAMMGASGLEALAEWFHPVLYAACLRAGKTAAEFWADVETEKAAFAAEMEREAT